VPSFLDAIEDRDPQSVINEVSFAIRNQHDPKGEDGLSGVILSALGAGLGFSTSFRGYEFCWRTFESK
jgi:hypothetical protein